MMEVIKRLMVKASQVFFLSLCVMMVSWLGVLEPVAIAQPLPHGIASPQPPSTVYIASFGGTVFKFSGKRPTNLGVKDGKLAVCPNSPNCVSSQAAPADAEHKIEPLSYTGSPAQAMAALKSVIAGMDRTAIITETEDYLYAEFTSALMGYVDDVEFYVEPSTQVIHVRSASRLGQSDLGVNRKRIEDIRARFSA